MKPLRSKKVVGTLLCVCALLPLNASVLHDLEIEVKLRANGEALISERRQASVDSEGTEFYLVMDNMGSRQVKDLRVTDERGVDFMNIGEWDTGASRTGKTHRCGLVTKANGYELCWGLGESGERTYLTRYTVTDLLQGYDDADGFNWMFVTRNMAPSPRHVRLTIEPEDEAVVLRPENTQIWAFGYEGNITFEGDSASGYKIVAESSEPFSARSAMIVMVRFEKELFAPQVRNAGSFEEVKERALEDSDYASDDSDITAEDWFYLIVVLLAFLTAPITFVFITVQKWRFRRKVNRDLLWYRDIPYNGNLQKSNDVLNALRYWGSDYNNLLSAYVLKLINLGALHIVSHQDRKGRMTEHFKVEELQDYGRQPLLMRKVYNIFKLAAGDDSILEPKELKQFMKSTANRSVTDSFLDTLHTKASLSSCKKDIENVRKLVGLKKFLKEFSLLDERGIKEVALWKDYMVYATLFGIADQVIRDMKKLNPEFFKMDMVANEMADNMTLPVITSTFMNSTSKAYSAKAAREARASGGGGHSSWSGGGGFSGGGSGGGIR